MEALRRNLESQAPQRLSRLRKLNPRAPISNGLDCIGCGRMNNQPPYDNPDSGVSLDNAT